MKQLQQATTELERELQKLQEMEKEKSAKEETLRYLDRHFPILKGIDKV